MKRKLTTKFIEGQKPDPSKRLDIRDDLMPGLVLRISTSGTKTFCLHKRINGKMRRLTIGRFPVLSLAEARERVRQVLYDIETGRPEMSVKRAEKLLEQSPNELMVLPVMSLGSLCAGRFHNALEWGERLLRSRPQDSLGLCLVFYSDLYLGKIERALLFAAYLRKQLREAKNEGRDDPLLEALVLLADCFEHPESAAARLPVLLRTSGRMSTRVLLTACAVLKNEELAKQCLAFLKKYSYRNLPLLDVDPYIQEQFAGRDWYIDRVRALAAG